MSSHRIELNWKRGDCRFRYRDYSRNHNWTFENGTVVEASATPDFLGDASKVDPEAAFVASLSSCHMLTFLAICAHREWGVERYEDHAVGYLEKENGKLWLSRVELNPRVQFQDPSAVSKEDLALLHEQSHRDCFLANSVKTQIEVNPTH